MPMDSESERANSVENMMEVDDEVTHNTNASNFGENQSTNDKTNEQEQHGFEPMETDCQQQQLIANNPQPHCDDNFADDQSQCHVKNLEILDIQDKEPQGALEHAKEQDALEHMTIESAQDHMTTQENLEMEAINEYSEMQGTQEHLKIQSTQEANGTEHSEMQAGTDEDMETQSTLEAQGSEHLEKQQITQKLLSTEEHLNAQETEFSQMQAIQYDFEMKKRLEIQEHSKALGSDLETQATQDDFGREMQSTQEHLKAEHSETQATQDDLEKEHVKAQGSDSETPGTQDELEKETHEHSKALGSDLETQATQDELEKEMQEHSKAQGSDSETQSTRDELEKETQEHSKALGSDLETQATQDDLEKEKYLETQEYSKAQESDLETQAAQDDLEKGKYLETQEYSKAQGSDLETQAAQDDLEKEKEKYLEMQEYLKALGSDLETQAAQDDLEDEKNFEMQDHLKAQGIEHSKTQAGTEEHVEMPSNHEQLERENHLETHSTEYAPKTEHSETRTDAAVFKGTQSIQGTQNYSRMQQATPHIKRSQSTEERIGSEHSRSFQLCGLQNLGNQCYMNATLQCLTHTHMLRECFLNPFQLPFYSSHRYRLGDQIVAAYINLQQIMCMEHHYVCPIHLKQTVGHFAPRFAGYAQEDAQEFLTFLLDGLHEGMNRVKEKKYVSMSIENGENWTDKEMADELWSRHLRRNKSEIVELFHSQIKSVLKCLTCTKLTKTFEPVMQLTLPLPSVMSDQNHGYKPCCKPSLYDCLKQYTKEKPLEWFCEHCFKQTANVQKYDIWKLAPILVIHLKRFSVTFSGMHTKVNTEVDFPERLDLSKYVVSDCDSVYQLYAVIDHVGVLYAGHYTAHVKEGDSWYLCNDHIYYKISLDDVLKRKSSAYVLFYKKCTMPSAIPF